MPEAMQGQLGENALYLGFVPDINTYIKAADVVLNPITSGGGVKTKVIEAISLGATVVSTSTGAIGVDAQACGPKLKVVPDAGVMAFAEAIKATLNAIETETPSSFYSVYQWDQAIKPALAWLS
jgi:glycosyltransferase involved in cell wall biosynthesis